MKKIKKERDPKGSHGQHSCKEKGCHGKMCAGKALAKSQKEAAAYRHLLSINPYSLVLPASEEEDEVVITPENADHYLKFGEYFRHFSQVAMGKKDIPWLLEKLAKDNKYAASLLLNPKLPEATLKEAYEAEKKKSKSLWEEHGFLSSHDAILANPNVPSEVVRDLLSYAKDEESKLKVTSHPKFKLAG